MSRACDRFWLVGEDSLHEVIVPDNARNMLAHQRNRKPKLLVQAYLMPQTLRGECLKAARR
eukprot:11179203-Karenia_brevis.AAC.1